VSTVHKKPPFLSFIHRLIPLSLSLYIVIITLIIITIQPISYVYAQDVSININSTSFTPGSMLVLYGRVTPNDSLIVEVINPMNRIVHRTQIDVDARGVFSSILLTFPNPNEQFMEGVYTIAVTSSIQGSVYSRSIVFQESITNIIAVQQGDTLSEDRRVLDVSIDAPSIVGVNEKVNAVVKVTLDGTLININGNVRARLIMPDTAITDLGLDVIDDGIYTTSFTAVSKGLHVITVTVEHKGSRATDTAGIEVVDTPLLSINDTLLAMNKSIDTLKDSMDNLEYRLDNDSSEIRDELERIKSSSDQALTLLLPIIGMITVIVALQATILARRLREGNP